MTVGPTVGGPEAARPAFRAVRRLVDQLGLRDVLDGHDRRPRGRRRGGRHPGPAVGPRLFGPRPELPPALSAAVLT